MRRASWLFISPLLLLLGCTRPEVEAFRLRPTPVFVTVTLPSGLGDRDAFQKEYAAALRARLSTRLMVVAEGTQPPVGASELRVDIREILPAPEDMGVPSRQVVKNKVREDLTGAIIAHAAPEPVEIRKKRMPLVPSRETGQWGKAPLYFKCPGHSLQQCSPGRTTEQFKQGILQ